MNSELAKYRSYLQQLARRSIDPVLRGKIDSSDLVQETLLNVGRRQGEFLELSEHERLPYLTQCLKNALHDQRRRYFSEKRAVGRERGINDVVDDASRELENWLAASLSSPSEHAVKAEMQLALANAIASLPDDQRHAFEMKHLDSLTLRQIAGKLNKSLPQVAGLLRRAKERLQAALPELRY